MVIPLAAPDRIESGAFARVPGNAGTFAILGSGAAGAEIAATIKLIARRENRFILAPALVRWLRRRRAAEALKSTHYIAFGG